ncbi:uncharacterized protein BXZ73DRAFT_75504 [Epithele typhae]|uniref:uncharacterized protein n=1 Tax=Epithele typhae TaxID=378194 RepID=UPI00200738F2|nr:uncharacterized protein BXZ73DRAFT_75504 [Epithele typhae]KAH9940397.1 hypothetical protein BXZ73DRAFT_75504 [Epithele typhae]
MSPRIASPAVLALVFLALRLSSPAGAQGTFGDGPGTSATCGPDYNWMNNHISPPQSPCYVASFLLSVCYLPADSWILPLYENETYSPPTEDSYVQCLCNSVWYNIIQACTTCQGRDASVQTWFTYTAACGKADAGPTIGSFPPGIPGLTAIPSWAFLDPTVTGTFDVNAASSVALSNPTDSTQAQSSTTSSTTNVGAIVGGVVGGVAALALIGGATYFLLRRRRGRKTHPGPSQGQFDIAPPSPPPPPMSMYGGSAATGHAAQAGAQPHGSPVAAEGQRFSDPLVPNKLYDPNDPSTFPNAQASRAGSAQSPTLQGSAQGGQLGYKGIPEM